MSRPLAVRRFTLVAVTLPAVLVAVALAAQVLALPALPDPVAIHWGASGSPDGFGPAWIVPVLTAAIGFGLPLVIAASALAGLRRGDRGTTYRLLGAVALAVSTMMCVLGTWTLVMQAGLLEAADGPSAIPAVLCSFGAAIAAFVAGWFAQPDEPYRVTVLAAPGRKPDTDSRGPWQQRTTLSRGAIMILVGAIALLVLMTLVTALTSGGAAPAWAVVLLIAVTVLAVVVVVSSIAFHVRVDDDGLSVTSVVGLPRVHIALADIARAEAVLVSPMGEFGGWGLRWAPGSGFGVVLRTGPGIRVTRTSGKIFTVTVDDAETGAALLDGLAARARAAG